ncbi:hypothetical protein L3X38_007127 [Prunus dulcis]|uniref:Uncharacterized protein n=1 Tax=Prunus dulcis TaxID=3755 RepID=A0AAD4ZTX4_PRUDU|nr:hypothetical protein L3X38_007127 [Prunus dulcis]
MIVMDIATAEYMLHAISSPLRRWSPFSILLVSQSDCSASVKDRMVRMFGIGAKGSGFSKKPKGSGFSKKPKEVASQRSQRLVSSQRSQRKWLLKEAKGADEDDADSFSFKTSSFSPAIKSARHYSPKGSGFSKKPKGSGFSKKPKEVASQRSQRLVSSQRSQRKWLLKEAKDAKNAKKPSPALELKPEGFSSPADSYIKGGQCA